MADKKISALTGATTPLAGTEVLPIVQSGSTVKVSIANVTAGRTVDVGTLITSGCPNPYGAKLANYGYAHFDSPAPGGTAMFFLSQGVDIGTFGQGNFAVTGGPVNGMGLSSVSELAFGVNGATEAFRATTAGNIKMKTAGTGIDFSANTHAAGMTSELLNDYEEGTFTPEATQLTTAPTITYTSRTGKYTKVGRVVTAHIEIIINTAAGGSGATIISGLPYAPNEGTYGGQGMIGYNDALANTVYGCWVSGTDVVFRSGTRSSANDTGGWSSGGYLALTLVYQV